MVARKEKQTSSNKNHKVLRVKWQASGGQVKKLANRRTLLTTSTEAMSGGADVYYMYIK